VPAGKFKLLTVPAGKFKLLTKKASHIITSDWLPK
jgi:hypothetical protein